MAETLLTLYTQSLCRTELPETRGFSGLLFICSNTGYVGALIPVEIYCIVSVLGTKRQEMAFVGRALQQAEDKVQICATQLLLWLKQKIKSRLMSHYSSAVSIEAY